MTITDDQLKEWRELADKAMPGPWMEMERCDDAPPGESCGVVSGLVAAHGGAVDVFASDAYDECSHPVTTADAAFIAAARTAVPALLAEVERLRAELKEAQAACFKWADSVAQRDAAHAELARLRPVYEAAKALAGQPMIEKGGDATWGDVARSQADGPRLLGTLVREVLRAQVETGRANVGAQRAASTPTTIDAAEAKERGDG